MTYATPQPAPNYNVMSAAGNLHQSTPPTSPPAWSGAEQGLAGAVPYLLGDRLRCLELANLGENCVFL
jgi:hypothetical protein